MDKGAHKFSDDIDINSIVKAIEDAKVEYEAAENFFDMVSDPKLIDYAIYRQEAARLKLIYFISQARDRGISVDTESRLQAVNSD